MDRRTKDPPMKRCFAHLDPFVPITRGGRKTTSRVRGIFSRLTYPVVLALVASSSALAPLPAQGQVSAANAPAGAAESESERNQDSRWLESDSIAVWIDDQPVVRWGEVEQLVRAQVDPERLTPDLRRLMLEQAQHSLAGRRLILLRLERVDRLPTDADVETAIDDLRTRIEAQGVDWDGHLAELGVTPEEFATSIRFRLGWGRVLESGLTEANLQKFFDDHRRDYDGTELELSQIVRVLRPETTEAERDHAIEELTEIKQRIEQGELTFAAAAEQFSDGATASDGGSLGRMTRENAMPDAFSNAAFDLEVGELSAVVVSPVGVHLIRCDAEHPGQGTLEESIDRVRADMIRYLFEWSVAEETKEHTVRYAPLEIRAQ